jgi:hemin uptake protein HemP
MLLIATLLALFLMSCNHNAGRLTAFINVNLVPMTDERIIESQTVLVEGSRIIAIGHSDELHVPKNAIVIDGDGYYLMPGLADMHMHTREDWTGNAWPVSPLILYLANGVTTIRDFSPQGTDLTYPIHWQEEISSLQAHWKIHKELYVRTMPLGSIFSSCIPIYRRMIFTTQ